jgi:hypothetical protein
MDEISNSERSTIVVSEDRIESLENLNSQVTRLYLVGIDGDYITNVIQHNTHLLEIQLSPFNRIGAEGAK